MPEPLRDYQTEGIAWLVGQLVLEPSHKAVLLADDMGLGKTRQALTAAYQLNTNRMLIICPAGARRVWQAEIYRWVPDWSPRVVLVEPGTNSLDVRRRVDDRAPLVLVIGYDELSNKKSVLTAYLQRHRRWDLLILDEAHYLKNPSNRTHSIYGPRGSHFGVQAHADRVILLTGTPTPNHAGELWQHYRTFWPYAMPAALCRDETKGVLPQAGRALSQAEFEERFTSHRDTVFGRQITGSKNQAQLREALKDVILRRRKDEVLTELPPLRLQDIPLDPIPGWRDRLSLDARGSAAKLDWALRSEPNTDRFFRAAAQDTHIATLRRELGLLKVTPTIAWVQERMASIDKLVLFAWHHSVIELLERGLAEFGPAVVTGETAPGARAEVIDRFQHGVGTRVFIGQILAAGTAISLTAASEVAIVEPSWVPGENAQAIARAHRLGQRDSVLASFLFLPDTLDETVMRVFRRKAGEISHLLGDSPDADNSQHGVRPGDRTRSDAVRSAAKPDPDAGDHRRIRSGPGSR